MKRLGLVLGGLMIVSGCTDGMPLGSKEQAATGPATVASDSATYNLTVQVGVSWSGMPTNSTDWIDIAPAGSPLTDVTRWVSTNGAASGSYTFEGPPQAGSYVVRGFSNDSYTLEGESDPFTVGAVTGATVTFGAPSYFIDDDITVNWSGLPGNSEDWISIAPENSADTVTSSWKYTGGSPSGSMTFSQGLFPTGYPGGRYVARAFINDTFTKVGESAAEQIGAIVTTDASTYLQYGTITVSWQNLDGSAQDWVALAPSGSAQTNVSLWRYTGGATSGSVAISPGLSSTGTYVARAFEKDAYIFAGESAPFDVTPAGAGVTVTSDLATYNLGDQVIVSWSGMPGNAQDWVSIAPAVSTDTAVTRWVYINGQTSGSFAFEGPATTGSYVARAYLNDTYAKLAESAAFAVQ